METSASALYSPAHMQQSTRFLSWANTLQVQDAAIVYPRSDAELQSLVEYASNQKGVYLRPLGNSHSLAPCVRDTNAPRAILVSLQHYQHSDMPVLHVDRLTATATVMAEVRLYDINRMALQQGLMLTTLSGIGDFTVAGFISNCTHGSFYRNGLFTRCVEAVRVVRPDGKIEWIEKSNPMFRFLLGGMGYFGFITHVKIRLQPAASLGAGVIPFNAPVKALASWLDRHLLPVFQQHQNTGITLVYDASGAGFLATLTPEATGNGSVQATAIGQNSFRLWGSRRQALFTFMARNMRSARLQKLLRKAFGNFSVFFLKYMTYKAQMQGGFWATTGFLSDVSRCLFLGYFVPVSSFADVQALVALMNDVMKKTGIYTELPLEIRFVQACDSQHLSPVPVYEPRNDDPFNNLYVAIDIPVNCGGLNLESLDTKGVVRDAHTTRMLDLYWRLEQAIKKAFPAARPHWSKFHSLQTDGKSYWAWDREIIQSMIPEATRASFHAMMQRVDPHSVFRNETEQSFLQAFISPA